MAPLRHVPNSRFGDGHIGRVSPLPVNDGLCRLSGYSSRIQVCIAISYLEKASEVGFISTYGRAVRPIRD